VFLQKDLYLLPYLFPNLIPHFPLQGCRGEEGREEEEKKRKTGQTTPGPDPATTDTPTTSPCPAGEE
jgi:hypothetical protein